MEMAPTVRSHPGIAARGLADMTPSERDRYLREYYAPEYRAELRKLADRGLLDEEEDGQ
jgi:hypothetical protein